ncbi:unnamed protein product, partial [Cylicocyclus nassatus]
MNETTKTSNKLHFWLMRMWSVSAVVLLDDRVYSDFFFSSIKLSRCGEEKLKGLY